MLRKLLLSLALIGSCSASYADSLVIDPNGTRAIWQNTTPTSTQVCPGATILQLPVGYNTNQIQNYQSDGNGNAVYVAPPAPPAPPPQPNPTGFLTAINNDSSVIASNFALGFQMAPLLGLFQADFQAQNMTALQNQWAAAKASGTYGVNSTVAAMVEGYATTYNIPLVTQ